MHGKEIAHLDDEDFIEIRLTRSVVRERRNVLKADRRIDLHYLGSDSVTVRLVQLEHRQLLARRERKYLASP